MHVLLLRLFVALYFLSSFTWMVECYSLPGNHNTNTNSSSRIRRSVRFPFFSSDSSMEQLSTYLLESFHHVIDSTSCFTNVNGECFVPVLGNAKVSFHPIQRRMDSSSSSCCDEFELSVEGGTEEDFGWICTRFFEYRSNWIGIIDTMELEKVVLEHSLRHQRESIGDDPYLAPLSNSYIIQQLFSSQPNIVQNLERNGYVIIDSVPSQQQQQLLTHTIDFDQLTRLLVKKSSQSNTIRNDKVAFLTRQEARSCGLEFQFDILMGIASYLNDHFHLSSWPFPGNDNTSSSSMLRNPKMVQVAEYGKNDFYVAHKDNSYHTGNGQARSNNRFCTCILYCNDQPWDTMDGGALRIYPGSHHYSCDEAKQKILPIDILPKNGRLVLFDCMLVHSVERVTHESKKRRAITVWINRPEPTTSTSTTTTTTTTQHSQQHPPPPSYTPSSSFIQNA